MYRNRTNDPNHLDRRHAALRRARAIAVLATLTALTFGCTEQRSVMERIDLPAEDWIAALAPAQNCDALVSAARPALLGAVESSWSGRTGSGRLVGPVDEFGAGADGVGPVMASRAAESPTGDAAASTVIGTNNQEVDVDEADLVKTDGRRLVAIVDGVLRTVTLDGTPDIDGVVDLGGRGASQLFLRGDTALVLGTTYGGVPAAPFPVTTTLTLVSLTGAGIPSVTATADVEGSLVTAREVGGRARIVVQGTPTATEQLYTATSRGSAIDAVTAIDEADLLPRVSVGGRVAPLGGCADVMVERMPGSAGTATPPASDAVSVGSPIGVPLETVTVLTVGDDLGDLQPVSVQGNAGTVYASAGALYVAGSSWEEAGSRTDVHRFALDGDGPAAYTGSGRAPGHLLDQFSLSDRDGALRIVTTLDGVGTPVPMQPDIGAAADERSAIDVAPVSASSARLTVLDTEGTLDEIGHLDGMGIGEQVQSVRFIDDAAYVVTFRQVDPLYALDLSDPTAPRLLGELKIPGFSQYLHPIGDGLLLGVGRQVDPDSGVDEGLKISLFDASDPTAPTESDQIVLPGAFSEVSSDHRAFLWDPTRRRAVVPVEFSCNSMGPCERTPGGAGVVLSADRSGLAEVGRFSHEPSPGVALQPTRTVLVDDDLWSVSVVAIGRTDADAPGATELLGF